MHEYLTNNMVVNTVKLILQKQEPWSIFCSGLQSAHGDPGQNLPAAPRPSSASAVCGKHHPASRTFRRSQPHPPGCAFLSLTMTKLSFKHKTFSQRGGDIALGFRNAPTRLHRAELSPRPAAASVCYARGWHPTPNKVQGTFSSLQSMGFFFNLGSPSPHLLWERGRGVGSVVCSVVCFVCF